MIKLSVIIPTYNPNADRLRQTITALKKQTLPTNEWELIIIDNNSPVNFIEGIDLHWQPANRLIREPEQGLTSARIRGFHAAEGEFIVLVDDDNVLEKDYLKNVKNIFTEHPEAGAIGGKCFPLFESPAPDWLKEFYGNLALRDFGDKIIIDSWKNTYPLTAPVGAGMAIRKTALESYLSRNGSQKIRITDRKGQSLSSGGDNDMVLAILRSGWRTGYFPCLSLTHIIPAERIQSTYLARLINHTNRSWVAVLDYHHINPWKKIPRWSVPLRKIKAWFTYAAWKSRVNHIRWSGACGLYDGLSDHNH